MPYWEMVTRSFKIAWRFKYLWLLAFFSGEAGGSFSFNSNPGLTNPQKGGQPPDFKAFSQPYLDWVTSHETLIVAGALVLVLVWIGFFILAAVMEGAVVRASAEHDAERPFGLGIAWRCGRATMGTILRLRLLLIALGLPVVIILAALVIGFVFALLGHNSGAAVVLALIGVLVLLATIPYALYLFFLDRLGTRAVVLEQLPAARAALGRAHRLVRKRLGRLLLVWLVAIATGIFIGICLAIATVVLILPVVLLGIALYASGGGAGVAVVIVLAALILLPILLAIQGFLAASYSTYWTLAFRRLEIDPAPADGFPYPYPPQSRQPAAPPTPSA